MSLKIVTKWAVLCLSESTWSCWQTLSEISCAARGKRY